MQQIGNQIGYKVRNIAHYGQPAIAIDLADSDGPRRVIASYSTMDTIQGTVTITAPHDIRFEDIDIAFVGTSQAVVDRMTSTPMSSGRTEAQHRFLVLRQPIAESDFPCPRIFEAGRAYKFPFTFIIPSQLLPKACSHKVASDHVRDMHCLLPPSLGDPDLAGFGSTLLDDLAPEMSKIVYAVKVKIAHSRGSEGLTVLAEKFKKVRVKPALAEQPPLNIDHNAEYQPRQEKIIRKGLFKGKLGTLTSKTIQPQPLVVPGARTTDNEPISTMCKLVLRFDPAEEHHGPPKLSSVATKIKASTFYSSAARQNFPSALTLGFDQSQGLYAENIHLSDLCVASAHWEEHGPNSNPISDEFIRRDSGVSDCSMMSASEKSFAAGILPATNDYKQGRFYIAVIMVPITLPTTKSFIPTFHSCLISRTYTLGLKMSINGLKMSLKVPVQICAEGSETGIENARARNVEEAVLREAADSLSPRRMTDAQRTGSVDVRDELPPDYAAWAPPSTRYRTSVSVVA
ncbi:hypothetical protein T440DRAFT_515638 [Plenodomus tracheiphilus IPT5]|uniref:Arrestin n=1 Tax=Plenodomus tracheiphilus IPT5 TaxID=1408161 RepID=A0A6A7BG91_9PLEO|nr:hypothetical protein T440DRAFT_515638 [Plenodomus tracheiphilus IPT5]